MSISLKLRLKNAFDGKEGSPTPLCLDIYAIGSYIEGKLSESDKTEVEEHLESCPYCLNRLVELKELLYYQKKRTAVSPELIRKIEALCPEEREVEYHAAPGHGILDKIAKLVTFPIHQWRCAAVSVAIACMVILLTFLFFPPEKDTERLTTLNPDAFVQVKAFDNSGRVIRESQGAIINAQGLVAVNLSTLIGASSVQVHLKDGKTHTVKSLWKDDGKSLAILKSEEGLPAQTSVADVRQVTVGEKVFIVADPAALKKGIAEAVISDLKISSSRKGAGGIQYIQLATMTAHYTQGVVVDRGGRPIGLLITGDRNISLATPFEGSQRLVNEQKPMSISSLQNMTFSPDALNFYFKGILARNAQDPDQAIECFKKAIELNPNLEGAHLELGFLYYKKRFFDLERKEYEDALRINPNSTDTLFYLATNMETKGRYDEAVKIYEKIVSLDPQDGDAYYELGLAYLAQGEKAKTLKVCDLLQIIDSGLAGKLRRISGVR